MAASALPALVERDGKTEAVHVEFVRRHQSLDEIALDLGEAQIRIRRRDGVQVSSVVYDLYGKRRGKVVEEQSFWLGEEGKGSKLTYQRVNLRVMSAAELLASGPRSFLALVPLTGDGAAGREARRELTPEVQERLHALTDVAVLEQICAAIAGAKDQTEAQAQTDALLGSR